MQLTQMQELVRRVHGSLTSPWQQKTGRPKSSGLYHAVEVACMYLRHNCTQEFLGDLRDISQSTVSRIVTVLVPVIKAVLEEFVPSAKDAIRLVQGKVCLVDGTITPCWSYAEHRELWSRKHGTTGFCVQVIGLLDGTPIWVSDPLPGKTHDKNAFDNTDTTDIIKQAVAGIGDKGYQGADLFTPTKKPRHRKLSKGEKTANAALSALRAPIERVVAHLKSWRILHTDYRRPYATYRDTFDAARGLFFFSIRWSFE
jgi:DDE superfamily endonuclease/Helix-turn-helix of DDE superfamily endonuclease